jgi:hypothetical protein
VFDVAGFRVIRLSVADAPALQDLFERATDFFELCEGGPPHLDAALQELTRIPDGIAPDGVFLFGMWRKQLDGVVMLLRDLRADATWWLGLLLLDPSVRGGGVGTRVRRDARVAGVSGRAHDLHRSGAGEHGRDALLARPRIRGSRHAAVHEWERGNGRGYGDDALRGLSARLLAL